MCALEIEVVTGDAIAAHCDSLADLRIRVFREWPYLYEGSAEYERAYLKDYAACPESVVVLAKNGAETVGASTGLPLQRADPEFRAPFEQAGLPVEPIFYFGESVLLPAYRGRGIGHRFFDLREAQAVKCGASIAAFCAVDRDPEDPRHPVGYRALDGFWMKRGYARHPDLTAAFDWKEVGQSADASHTLSFWLKQL